MRTRIRSSTVSGLTLALETPVGLVRGPFARLWRPEATVKPSPRIELGVRLAWPAPEAGALNIVRSIGSRGRIAAEFEPRGVVLAELSGARALRVVRVDAGLRQGIVECAPEVLAERPCDPLGILGPFLAHHRLVREGAAVLTACVARTSAGTLVFASDSPVVRQQLMRRLERGRPSWLAEGAFVARMNDGQATLEPTPWTRVGSGGPGRLARILAWHVAYPAPALLAEPLLGRRASDGLRRASALLPGDTQADSLERDVVDRLVERERVVRLGFPDDERLLRYAFARPTSAGTVVHGQTGGWRS
ncbi:MAG: hypothetical protein OEP95_03905 [Myxococcales bacterium]|nr:hypothetical protein [Myxococcales bacterium]